ncbi:helix-turn-helix domain-containing protein [Myroides odoratimimus]|uniref:helix-turn-helix domain-containing protein n=1 Tax=Myroides odoratimimus TaxID=76832 RepID=UPI002DB80273|nr:helix-turn-helix domain-containing protein [Myroides odoratimimus]MEC4052080.1 helix-turn-helix domain-containing protein [Myroides odoratimimus]
MKQEKNNLIRRERLESFTYAVFRFSELSEEHLQVHRDSHYIFVLQEEGVSTIELDFKQVNIEGTSLGFIIADQVHCYTDLSEAKGSFLIVDKSLLSVTCINILTNPQYAEQQFYPITPNDISYELVELCSRLSQENNADQLIQTGKSSIVAGVIECLVSRIKQLNQSTLVQPSYQYQVLTTNFKQLVEQQFQNVKQVQQYADQLNISALYLNEVIKKATGTTPIELIHERIIIEAKRMLYYTAMSSKEIAYQLGYEDYSYFSAFFKKRVGMSPSQFRTTSQEIQ